MLRKFVLGVATALSLCAPGAGVGVASAATLKNGDILVTSWDNTAPTPNPSLIVLRYNGVSYDQILISSGGSLANPNEMTLTDDYQVVIADSTGKLLRVDPVTAILRVPPSGGASPPLLPTWSQPTDPQPTAPPDCHWAHCSSSDLCSS